jgi:hypothetical protein
MHALPILKQACLEALETDGEPGDPGRFFSIVDPRSVLELVQIAETRITDEEVTALHEVVNQLCDYIRRTTADKEGAELVRHAQAVVGVTTR